MAGMEPKEEPWKVIKLDSATYIQSGSHALLNITYVDQSKFELILDVLRQNSLPVTDVMYNGYGRVTDEHWTRLTAIMEALEQNNTVKSLAISCGCIADEGSKPFFKRLASPQCKLQKLSIGMIVTVKRALLFKKALKKNKSVQDLQLSSNTHPILSIFKTNTTITSLAVRSAALGNTVKALKANRTLEQIALRRAPDDIFPAAGKREELFCALAAIGSLKLLSLDITGSETCSLKSLADVLKNNAQLSVLMLAAEKKSSTNLFLDMDVVGRALAQHQSLTWLSLSSTLVPILELLGNTSVLQQLFVELRTCTDYPWFADVITSISSLESVTFSLSPNSDQAVVLEIDLTALLRAESSVQRWRFNCDFRVNSECFAVLKTRPLRPCRVICKSDSLVDWKKLSELTVANPFLEVKFLESYEAERSQVFSNCTEKRRTMLSHFKTLFLFLAIISLTQQDHLFSTLPNEVLLLICQHIGNKDVSAKTLLRAIARARDREFMLRSGQKNNVPTLVRFWMEQDI